jgi:hypothetical protein
MLYCRIGKKSKIVVTLTQVSEGFYFTFTFTLPPPPQFDIQILFRNGLGINI